MSRKNARFGGYEDRKVRQSIFMKEDGSLYPVCCGLHMCPNGMEITGVRNHWLLVAVRSGFGTVTCGGREWEAGPGDAFMLFRDVPHRYAASDSDPWVYSWIGFGGTKAAEMVERSDFAGCNPVVRGVGEKLDDLLWENAEQCIHTDDYDLRYLNAFAAVNQTLHFLIKHGEKQANPGQNSSAFYSRIAEQIVELYYGGDVSVQEIADQIGLSRSYLSTVFRQETGMTVIRYLRDFRVKQAKILLKNTSLSVMQIAEKVGIPDCAYFSRTFREIAGCTPSEYRERNAEDGKANV